MKNKTQVQILFSKASCLAILLLLCSQAAFGQTESRQPEKTQEQTGLRLQEGWHIVRPGDTLEKISKKYLGAPIRWSENWEINPEISDPNRIFPGQRLRILLPGRLPSDGALVFKISRQVEDQLLPLSWQDAQQNDLLQPMDSLRTFDNASAELLFFDDTHLILSESSLVLIGKEKQTPQPQDPTQIQIVLGQADLSGSLPASSDDSIEIILGDATAQPKANASGEVETRARRPEEGGAQLMVYQGESALEAAGTRIDVPQGMGSAVPEGQAPGPPEKLLPAAEGLIPPDGTLTDKRQPELRWDLVDGASSYTVEICHDPRCGLLVARQTNLTQTTWTSDDVLPFGKLMWRVTAVSPSGLDGFPSPAAALEISDRPLDHKPPQISLRFTGPKAWIDGALILGPGFEAEIEVEDENGVESWTPIVDGQPTTLERLHNSLDAGKHTLVVQAVDKAGNQGRSDARSFYFDPDPPDLSWGIEKTGLMGDNLAERYAEDGPLATQQGRRLIEAARKTWRLDSDYTQVVLRSARRKIRLKELVEQRVTREQGLWVLAKDPPCKGATRVAYELETRAHPDSRRPVPWLVVDAKDCVGNRSRIAWPLLLGRR